MLNQVNLVGRLVKEASLHISENGKKSTFVTLAVPRSFKNINGEYETDLLIAYYGKTLQNQRLSIATKVTS